MPNDASISIRLPETTRRALDAAANKARRSRAFIVKEALDQYLKNARRSKLRLKEWTAEERRAGLQRILEIQRQSADRENYRTAQEVIDFIRDIRGD